MAIIALIVVMKNEEFEKREMQLLWN